MITATSKIRRTIVAALCLAASMALAPTWATWSSDDPTFNIYTHVVVNGCEGAP